MKNKIKQKMSPKCNNGFTKNYNKVYKKATYN